MGSIELAKSRGLTSIEEKNKKAYYEDEERLGNSIKYSEKINKYLVIALIVIIGVINGNVPNPEIKIPIIFSLGVIYYVFLNKNAKDNKEIIKDNQNFEKSGLFKWSTRVNNNIVNKKQYYNALRTIKIRKSF